MKGRGILGSLFAGILMTSCGLDSVSVLSVPDVIDNDLLITPSSLTFHHSGSRYSGQDFLGYLVYYKIYPAEGDLTLSKARLLADRSLLSSSPTVDRLVSLGYQRFGVSSSAAGGSSIDDLSIEPTGDVDLTLDFSDFLDDETGTSQPVVLFDGLLTGKPYLYRTKSLAGIAENFDSLRALTSTRQVDMASNMTADELAAKKFEINVFVAAFGVDPLLTEVRSSPVPWGVIRDIKPF